MTEEEIRAVIADVDYGTVKTHSQITLEACAIVGRVQNKEPDGWHRVVYKNGRVKNERQRQMLTSEGVEFISYWRVKLPD